MVLAVVEAVLMAETFLECPFTGLVLPWDGLTSPSAMRFLAPPYASAVVILSWAAAIADNCNSWLSWVDLAWLSRPSTGPPEAAPPPALVSLAGGVKTWSEELGIVDCCELGADLSSWEAASSAKTGAGSRRDA